MWFFLSWYTFAYLHPGHLCILVPSLLLQPDREGGRMRSLEVVRRLFLICQLVTWDTCMPLTFPGITQWRCTFACKCHRLLDPSLNVRKGNFGQCSDLTFLRLSSVHVSKQLELHAISLGIKHIAREQINNRYFGYNQILIISIYKHWRIPCKTKHHMTGTKEHDEQ